MHSRIAKQNINNNSISLQQQNAAISHANSSTKTKNRIFAVIFLLLIIFTIDRVFIHPSYRPNHRYQNHLISSHDNTHAYLNKIRQEQEQQQQKEMLAHDLKQEAGMMFMHPEEAKRNFHRHLHQQNHQTHQQQKESDGGFSVPLIQRSMDSVRQIPKNKFDTCPTEEKIVVASSSDFDGGDGETKTTTTQKIFKEPKRMSSFQNLRENAKMFGQGLLLLL